LYIEPRYEESTGVRKFQPPFLGNIRPPFSREHYALGVGLNVVGTRAITRHVLWTVIAAHVVAMVRLQHGVTGNLLSTTHIQ
jgi:hypothetical protein